MEQGSQRMLGSCLTSGMFHLSSSNMGLLDGFVRAMTHNPEMYPEPDKFLPERHLEGHKESYRDPRDFTFGSGKR